MLSNYKHNQQLVALAYSDSLTGLPNKTYLEEVLAEAVAKPAGGKGAVLMIHCRNLSEINSTYGFTAGDQILKAIAKKLADLECRGCQLFRFTANRFVFYVEGYQHREELADLAERISRVVEQSQNFIQRQLQLYTGIVELTGAERSVDALLTQASVALQHIESGTGTGKYAFMTPGWKQPFTARRLSLRKWPNFCLGLSLTPFTWFISLRFPYLPEKLLGLRLWPG